MARWIVKQQTTTTVEVEAETREEALELAAYERHASRMSMLVRESAKRIKEEN